MAFPTTVNIQQAIGVEGDFAAADRWRSVEAGQGAFVAASGGVTVGRFAWADSSLLTVANAGSGAPTGFVHREVGLGRITGYPPQGVSMLIPAGHMVTLMEAGSFLAKNAGAGAVTFGMKAFANNTNGSVSFAAAGATVTGSTETKWFAKSAGAAGDLIKISDVL
jgi:hypothetical protein